jgi:hypothetical protein
MIMKIMSCLSGRSTFIQGFNMAGQCIGFLRRNEGRKGFTPWGGKNFLKLINMGKKQAPTSQSGLMIACDMFVIQ